MGEFLPKLKRPGATRDCRVLINDSTGEEFSAKAMLDYYTPLQKWLGEQNRRRPAGWRAERWTGR